MRRYAQMNTTKQDADISLIALSANGEYGAATLRAEFPFGIWHLNESRCETVVKCQQGSNVTVQGITEG